MIAFLKGFLQDPNGKSSSVRLVILLYSLGALGVGACFCFVFLKHHDWLQNANYVIAVNVVLGWYIGKGAVAIYQRTTPGDDPTLTQGLSDAGSVPTSGPVAGSGATLPPG